MPSWTNDDGSCAGCPLGCRSCRARERAAATSTEIERKATAYNKIACAYKLGTSVANVDRCVTEACFARELRDEAMRTRDQAVKDAVALRETLAWALRIIDHELPPQPDPRGDDGEMQSQHYFFEGMRAARALVGERTPLSNSPIRNQTEEPK